MGAEIRYALGEFAALLHVDVDRVRKWTRRGWIRCVGAGRGPGRPAQYPQRELEVARRAVSVMNRYDVEASERLFARVRRDLA